VGPNERGELLIKGLHVTKGYLHNESATKDSITEDGWLKTGVFHFWLKSHKSSYLLKNVELRRYLLL